MQPYVIMRGIQEGIVDEQAKQALSSPEQGDLYPQRELAAFLAMALRRSSDNRAAPL
jgi:hypothetical protein